MRFLIALLMFALLNQEILGIGSKVTPYCGQKLFNKVYETNKLKLHILGNDSQSIPHEWPWVLQVIIRPKTPPLPPKLCGAVLIQVCNKSPRSDIAVTAAHCVTWYNNVTRRLEVHNPNGIEVIGRVHMYPGFENDVVPQVRRVKKIILHDSYPIHTQFIPEYEHLLKIGDIALLVLYCPMGEAQQFRPASVIANCTVTQQYGNQFAKVYPICMPRGRRGERELAEWMEQCYIAGWGIPDFDENGTHINPYLQHSRHRVLRKTICMQRIYISDFPPRVGIMASELEKKVICSVPTDRRHFGSNGDSGGPLMCKDHKTKFWSLQGIYTDAVSRNGNLTADVHQSIRFYAGWIYDNVQKNSRLCMGCTGPRKPECKWFEFN